ncbi:MAG: hypothetical protein QM784_08350 [Polyangiaceae bacterium]
MAGRARNGLGRFMVLTRACTDASFGVMGASQIEGRSCGVILPHGLTWTIRGLALSYAMVSGAL